MEYLKSYTTDDLEKILKVLKEQQKAESLEKDRLRKIEIENDFLKRMVSERPKSCFSCNICSAYFIVLLQPSYICECCHQEYCQNCTKFFKNPRTANICRLCYLEQLKKHKSGKWLSEKAQNQPPSTRKGRPNYQRQIRENILCKSREPRSSSENRLNDRSQESDNNEIDRLYRYLQELIVVQNRRISEEDPNAGSSSSINSMKSTSFENILKMQKQPLRLTQMSRINSQFFPDTFDENTIISSTPNSNSPISESSVKPVTNLHKSVFRKSPTPNENHAEVIMRNNPKLTAMRSSLNSLNSNASRVSELFTNDIIIKGKIHIRLDYNQKSSQLTVTVVGCENLSIADIQNQTTDPFVKVHLLPDLSKKFKTKIVYRNADPDFNETFKFSIPKTSLNDRTLHLSVWHHQKNGSGLFLGEVNIRMETISFADEFDRKFDLKIRKIIKETRFNEKEHAPNLISLYKYIGEILIKLEFKSNSASLNSLGRLNVMVRSARNLASSLEKSFTNKETLPNPYAECTFFIDGTTQKKHKTSVQKSTSNPVWNENFYLDDTSRLSLRRTTIEIVIYNKFSMRKNVPIGKIIFTIECHEKQCSVNNEDCKEKDVLLWRSLINSSPNENQEAYIPLRSIF